MLVYIYTLIVQIIVTLNNRDGFMICAFLVGGVKVNLELDDANNRDGFRVFSQSSEQIIMTVLYLDYSIFFTYLVR